MKNSKIITKKNKSNSEIEHESHVELNVRTTCNREKIIHVIKIQPNSIARSLQDLEENVRFIFCTNDYIQCQVFMSASYVQFKMACAQQMQAKHKKSCQVNLGNGYLARLVDDTIVLLFRQIEFGLPNEDTTTLHTKRD
jgi:hypothetical protein